ncbi:hypothetical protein GC176_11160 [bacterium]|nr:hypothetical protein [bacterium]
MARTRYLLPGILLLSVRLLPAADQTRQQPELIWPPQGLLTPSVLHEDPYLPVPGPINQADPAILPLLEDALASGESDLKRDAAVSIIRIHRNGYIDCSSLAAALTHVLQSNEKNRLVLKDVARALVSVDASESAAALSESIGRDADLVRIIEPALARWSYGPVQDEWLRRLGKFETEPQFLVLSAIRGLGETRNPAATELLQQIVLQSPRATYRLASASALGNVQRAGLEGLAGQLLREESAVLSPSSATRNLLHRQLAVLLLRWHSSDAARKSMLSLATDSNGAVAVVAWESLLRTAPKELRAVTEQSASANDPNVRNFVVQTLRMTPDASAVEQLGRILSDRHPDVRNAARRALLAFSEIPELRNAVLSAGTSVLEQNNWEGVEQSAVLLGTLDHEPIADRCFELLTHPRTEAAVAAAWALRKLAIPATLPRMLTFCERIDAALEGNRGIAISDPPVAGHLFEAMGLMDYKPADELLRRYVPKRDPRLLVPMRRSAINALGWLHAGSEDEELSAQFYARIVDQSPLPIYELDEVRYAATIAIGRIKAAAFEPKFRARYSGFSTSANSYALEWALTQFTGEPLGEVQPTVRGLPLLPLKPLHFRQNQRGSDAAVEKPATPAER